MARKYYLSTSQILDESDWTGEAKELKRQLEALFSPLGDQEVNLALSINQVLSNRVSFKPRRGARQSPLETLELGKGNCFDLTVLAVAAERVFGIPARAVIATDMLMPPNDWRSQPQVEPFHSWLEIFVDGSWHFIGACEPAAKLDESWFVEVLPTASGIYAVSDAGENRHLSFLSHLKFEDVLIPYLWFCQKGVFKNTKI